MDALRVSLDKCGQAQMNKPSEALLATYGELSLRSRYPSLPVSSQRHFRLRNLLARQVTILRQD